MIRLKFLSIILILILILPSIFFITFDISFAYGMLVSSVIVFLYSINFLKKIFFVKYKLLFFLSIFMIFFLQSIYFFINFDNQKSMVSLFVLIFCFFCFFVFSHKLQSLDKKYILISIKQVFYILLSVGWLSIFYKFFFNGLIFDAIVFPFSEPSHYALCIGPLAIISAFFSGNIFKLIIVVNLVVQALLFPNLTLLFYVFILVFLTFFIKNLIHLLLGGAGVITLAIMFFSSLSAEHTKYYTSRLTLDSNTENLSALVFLQGIDDAKNSFIETNGFGLGFQMAGTNEAGIYGRTIQSMVDQDLNRLDGGFLSSKIISEFGILGLFIVLFYLFLVVKALLLLKNEYSRKGSSYDLRVISAIILISFIVEVFLRGYGYFSPVLFILISFYLSQRKSKKLFMAIN